MEKAVSKNGYIFLVHLCCRVSQLHCIHVYTYAFNESTVFYVLVLFRISLCILIEWSCMQINCYVMCLAGKWIALTKIPAFFVWIKEVLLWMYQCSNITSIAESSCTFAHTCLVRWTIPWNTMKSIFKELSRTLLRAQAIHMFIKIKRVFDEYFWVNGTECRVCLFLLSFSHVHAVTLTVGMYVH